MIAYKYGHALFFWARLPDGSSDVGLGNNTVDWGRAPNGHSPTSTSLVCSPCRQVKVNGAAAARSVGRVLSGADVIHCNRDTELAQSGDGGAQSVADEWGVADATANAGFDGCIVDEDVEFRVSGAEESVTEVRKTKV